MTRIVLHNATLIDGINPVRKGMSLIIEGKKIENIMPTAEAVIQTGDNVYDLAGMTVMPGMINAHYHATYQDIGATPLPVGMEAPPALQTLRAAKHLGMVLDSGFTGVVSAGAPYAIDAACKLAIEEGLITGPRMMAGSRDVSTTGHCQDSWQWHWGAGSSAQTNIVDGPEGFRRAVREEIKRGAEIIKIFATAGHAVPGVLGKMDLAEDELHAAIQAAHARRVKVRAHIANKEAILTAVKLNIDVVDHGDGLDQQCIDLMLERGATLVPSMLYIFRVMALMDGSVPDHMKQSYDAMLKILPVANQCGLNIVLGDDFGALGMPHGGYADELSFYVDEVGIPPQDVIRWATVNGAKVMDRSHEAGFLQPGFFADLLIVKGDPLKNIDLIRPEQGLVAVMKDGHFVHHALRQA